MIKCCFIFSKKTEVFTKYSPLCLFYLLAKLEEAEKGNRGEVSCWAWVEFAT